MLVERENRLGLVLLIIIRHWSCWKIEKEVSFFMGKKSDWAACVPGSRFLPSEPVSDVENIRFRWDLGDKLIQFFFFNCALWKPRIPEKCFRGPQIFE